MENAFSSITVASPSVAKCGGTRYTMIGHTLCARWHQPKTSKPATHVMCVAYSSHTFSDSITAAERLLNNIENTEHAREAIKACRGLLHDPNFSPTNPWSPVSCLRNELDYCRNICVVCGGVFCACMSLKKTS